MECVYVAINPCPVFRGGEELGSSLFRVNVVVVCVVTSCDPFEAGGMTICCPCPSYLGVQDDAAVAACRESCSNLLFGAAYLDA